MRLVDAKALSNTICKERDRIYDTYGANDEYVRCLNRYAISIIENAPTIDAIPVEWFRKFDADPLIKNAAHIVLTMWQKEQEAQDG